MNESYIWKIQECDGADYLSALLRFILPEYSRIFGQETMFAEECIIYNDTAAECPMLITTESLLLIRLAQSSLSFWAQTIFQLSHELCHYAIRQRKINKDFTLSWFEEIVCEAMSLYALHWAAKNWGKCKLSQMNPQFSNSIQDYLDNELNAVGTDEFKKCITLEQLIKYEREQSTDRQTHKNERNHLFYEIVQAPEECICFCDYSSYLNKNCVTLDFERWKKNDNRKIIRFLHDLQPYTSLEY